MEQYKRLIGYLKPYWWIIVIATIFSLCVSAVTGAMAWYVKPIVDGVNLDKDMRIIKIFPFVYIGFFVLKGLFSFAHSFLMRAVGAKVVRDAMMRQYSSIYPKYHFWRHKGYGTRQHFSAIKKHGPTIIHRRSFLR